MALRNKGVSADIFIWIFATLAGVLLLFFFILWSGRHASVSTTVEDYELLKSFEQQLLAFGTQEEASKTLTFPRDVSIRVDCTSFFTAKAREKTSVFLFSPSLLQGKMFTIVAQPWHFPFLVDTFYFLAPAGQMIVLVYDANAASYVQGLDLPATLPLKKLPLSSFSVSALAPSLKGYHSLTFVFFGQPPPVSSFFSAFRPAQVSVVQVSLDQQEVTFLTASSSEQSFFLGDAMLLGSFFSPSTYSCLQERALARLQMMSELYLQKTTLLSQKVAAGSVCQQYLRQGATLLSTLVTLTDQQPFDQYATSLEQVNKELERHDCPTIY